MTPYIQTITLVKFYSVAIIRLFDGNNTTFSSLNYFISINTMSIQCFNKRLFTVLIKHFPNQIRFSLLITVLLAAKTILLYEKSVILLEKSLLFVYKIIFALYNSFFWLKKTTFRWKILYFYSWKFLFCSKNVVFNRETTIAIQMYYHFLEKKIMFQLKNWFS